MPSADRRALRLLSLGAFHQAAQRIDALPDGLEKNFSLAALKRCTKPQQANGIYSLLYDGDTGIGIPARVELEINEGQHYPQRESLMQERLNHASTVLWRALFCDAIAPIPQLGPSFKHISGDLLRDDTRGSSADLALALMTLALWLEKPLPQIVAATGELGSDGEVHRVQFTDAKLSGLALEFPDTPLKVLVPIGTQRPASLPPRVEVVEVGTLLEAAKLIFPDFETSSIAVNERLLSQLLDAFDRGHRRGDREQNTQITQRLNLDAIRSAFGPLVWAQTFYRVAAHKTHHGQDIDGTLNDEALSIAQKAISHREMDVREYPHYVTYRMVALVREARSSDAALAVLERALADGHINGIPLGPDATIEIRGSLALQYAQMNDNSRAVELRRENLSAHLTGGPLNRLELARTWSYLIWEAARAHQFELSEQAWTQASQSTDDHTQWLFTYYNRFRALEAQDRCEELIELFESEPIHPSKRRALASFKGTPSGYPATCGRRPIAEAYRRLGRLDAACLLLEADFTRNEEPTGNNHFLFWHQCLSGIHLVLTYAQLGRHSDALAKQTLILTRFQKAAQPHLHQRHCDLFEAFSAWTPGQDPAPLLVALRRIYY